MTREFFAIMNGLSIGFIAFAIWNIRTVMFRLNEATHTRLKKLEDDFKDVQREIILVSRVLGEERKASMAKAIQDAIDNPQKYEQGYFGPVMIKGGEKEDETP